MANEKDAAPRPTSTPAPEFDARAVEKQLLEEEKENRAHMDKSDEVDGQTKYAGGPIPPAKDTK